MKRKTQKSHRKTRKNRPQTIVVFFLQMLNTVKLYHWNTFSYAQHKATDELYAQLNTNVDRFVEVMLGQLGGRAAFPGQPPCLQLRDYSNVRNFAREIQRCKAFLQSLQVKDALLNIRDEMLGNLDQVLYLLTFR